MYGGWHYPAGLGDADGGTGKCAGHDLLRRGGAIHHALPYLEADRVIGGKRALGVVRCQEIFSNSWSVCCRCVPGGGVALSPPLSAAAPLPTPRAAAAPSPCSCSSPSSSSASSSSLSGGTPPLGNPRAPNELFVRRLLIRWGEGGTRMSVLR